MVNSPQNTWKVDNIKPFVESILKEDKIDVQPLEKTKQAYLSEESTTPNTPRDKTFSQMRLQLANIEAEFVLHRENTKQTISELSRSIETKDKEIVTLKNTEREKQQTISDLTLKLLQMEENINALNTKIEEKNSNLQQSVHKIQNESCAEKCTWASMSPPPPNTTEEYNIPTSNTFDLLTDDVINQGNDSNEHVELTSKGNKEKNIEDGVQQNDSTQQDLPPTYCPTKGKLTTCNKH